MKIRIWNKKSNGANVGVLPWTGVQGPSNERMRKPEFAFLADVSSPWQAMGILEMSNGKGWRGLSLDVREGVHWRH
jgi:hypothetical protein